MVTGKVVGLEVKLTALTFEVKLGDATIRVTLENFTPVGGVVHVANVGESDIHVASTVLYHAKPSHTRTLAADIGQLVAGQSICLNPAVMPPGEISIQVGPDFESLCEVIRIPSPGSTC